MFRSIGKMRNLISTALGLGSADDVHRPKQGAGSTGRMPANPLKNFRYVNTREAQNKMRHQKSGYPKTRLIHRFTYQPHGHYPHQGTQECARRASR